MLYGIALLDSLPFRIECDVTLKKGSGDILISGPVDDNVEETINASIGFADTICGFEATPFPDLSNHNLLIRIGLPASRAPIVGPSLGLLVGLQIVLTLTGRRSSFHAFVTGELTERGEVFAVGSITAKRRGVAEIGGERLILPATQLDFFSTDIIQIPVSSIYEAYTCVTYGQTKR